jgi:excisionase family DNA binding protein
METEPRWYTIKEVAERLRVSHDTVTRMIEREELPAIRVSARLVRIPAPALHLLERGIAVGRRDVVRRRVSQGVRLGTSESIPAAETTTR